MKLYYVEIYIHGLADIFKLHVIARSKESAEKKARNYAKKTWWGTYDKISNLEISQEEDVVFLNNL